MATERENDAKRQDAEKADAIRAVMEARYSSHPDVLRENATLRHIADMEARARDVYANEQGNKVGVKERAAQFVDKLLERSAQSEASRNVLAMSARMAMDESAARDRAVREREDALRGVRGRDDAELSEVKEQRKAAEQRAMWSAIPKDEQERPLLRERTHDLMAAAAVAAERETKAPSSENRRKAALVEEELTYRRIEVAKGERPFGELRPQQMETSVGKEGEKLLARMERKEGTPDRSAEAEKKASKVSERDVELER